jgi:hypothetical protein
MPKFLAYIHYVKLLMFLGHLRMALGALGQEPVPVCGTSMISSITLSVIWSKSSVLRNLKLASPSKSSKVISSCLRHMYFLSKLNSADL